MAYTALDVAKYIVTYCFDKSMPVSNLKLQKMLYYSWIDYYKNTGKELFFDDICAWQLGPVVPETYYEFCVFAGRPITLTFDVNISMEDATILNDSIEKNIRVAASTLVNRTHEKGKPWDLTYRDGAGNRDVIAPELIIAKECA